MKHNYVTSCNINAKFKSSVDIFNLVYLLPRRFDFVSAHWYS